MSAFSDRVHIARTKEEVFDFLTSFDNAQTIMPNVVKNEILTEGPMGVGTRFRETREIKGREAASIIEITEFDKPNTFSVRSDVDGLSTFYHYTLTDKEGGTEVDFVCNIEAETLRMKLVKPIFKQIMKKEDGDHVQKMKEAMEKQES
ncbi:SRPBCC family protein [Pontibacillus salicampi]|uniref:SRPBCC family protein n=1 Tax=Pontibacillus salicampi TaxID=1449801 RepID=A0ABV6LI90_9BACI